MQASCAKCEAIRTVELVQAEETVMMHGRLVTYCATYLKCLSCGEDFEMPGMLDDNLRMARMAYERDREHA